MIKIGYSHPRKLHEIWTVHDEVKKLVSAAATTKTVKMGKHMVNLNPSSTSFIEYLNDNGQAVLNDILTKTPDILCGKYIRDIETLFPDFVTDKAKVGKRNQTFSQVRDVAYTIFVTNGYEKLKHKAEFYAALDVKVCPYCNRCLIEPIDDGAGKRTVVGELDHFYCKSKYPYLAVSLYNLVPSCGICNGKSRKGEKDLCGTMFRNPYLLPDNNGMTFGFKPTGVSAINYEDSYKRYHIRYIFSPDATLKYNFDILKLRKIYSGQYYREKVCKIECVVRDFCNQTYVDSQVAKFADMGINLSFSSLIRERLEVSDNPDEYNYHVNNKFVMDVFKKMVAHINKTLLIK